MDRTILHCDCNGFYASVECILRPELKNVPMAVCGDPESRHGIILAKNELAKKSGVLTAETIWQAKKKCPNLVLVPSHHALYEEYSQRINQIYQQYTDRVEPFGIDESWLDVTGSEKLFGDGKHIADQLRERMKKEIGLTLSVGVSFNKAFAKLGSDYKKPDATTVISRENYKNIVYPLPVTDLLYVGKNAKNMLGKMGIATIGELARARREDVSRLLGKTGDLIWEYANGLDESPVRRIDEAREIKSVGNGITFRRNLVGYADIYSGLVILSDMVASRLRRYGYYCQTVQLTIRDAGFRTISRQKTLAKPTHLAKELSRVSFEIIKECWEEKRPVRMLTVTGTGLTTTPVCQLSLFDAPSQGEEKKKEHLERAMDRIREKFGREALAFGAEIHNDIVMAPEEKEEE